MIVKNFVSQTAEYAAELKMFIQKYNLPNAWFEVPDHVALKCANAENFDATASQFKEASLQI